MRRGRDPQAKTEPLATLTTENFETEKLND